jgi:signal transduction histidine kinase/DNA-binding LacI/PurR family transcriptional regulator/AraC-like DNA-binding protein
MLTAWLKGPTEINLWHGVADQAQARDVNLFCFSGGIPHWPVEYEAQKNILFNIAGQPNVDGLLIWANILSHTLDRSSLEEFCRRYAPLPSISMGMVLPSIPSIKIDMREGMRRLLSHLIEVHGRQQIAFIRGSEVSQDAQDRYQAYCETLSQYGLPLDPGLIVPGDFRRNSGKAAIEELIDKRRVRFNAVVSANDNMAIGALQALQERGVRVPDDVVVTGFDDIEETRAVAPTLTTVRCPWHMLGRRSVDLVLSKLAGEPLAEQILLPTELVCRQSCGCQPFAFDDHPERATRPGQFRPVPHVVPQLSAPLAVDEHAWQIEAVVLATASVQGLDAAWCKQLVNDFISDARASAAAPSRFTQTLLASLRQIASGTELIEWQDVLHAFRDRIGFLLGAPAEVIRAHELLEAGYAAIGEMAHRQQLNQRLAAVDRTDRLNRIVQTMSTTNELETLMQLLALELPGLGIQSCYLSLYDEQGDSPAWSRLILACVGQERLPLDRAGLRYPTRHLVPAGMLPRGRRASYDVEALYFKGEQIGLVMFEIGPRDGDVYTTLRGHLSSALKSAELIQVALDAETRAVKADQLKTHLLANVSHELRTPLNIILGLSQSALASPNPYEIELPGRLAKDLKYIFDCGEYLVRLVNDLLDMSRAEVGELDLCFEPVSPRALLKETFDSFQESSISAPKDVELFLEIPEHLPMLQADPVRLRQILINLLSNAVKFTPSGSIHLGAEVQLPHIHLWVRDTGTGIPLEMQERIFEPFVKVDPPEKRRAGIGLGLSITRRLVALHGGSISLESQPQRGTSFHVYLPLPGLDRASAQAVDLQGAQPLLLWLSSSETPAEAVVSLCLRSGLNPRWIGNLGDVDQILLAGRPVALAWDLEHSRPGDWSIIQKLRRNPQFCQLPLLLYQGTIAEKTTADSRLTNVVLKPAGAHTLRHVLDLLPQALQRGEIWIVDDDPQALEYYQSLLSNFQADFVVRPIHGGAEALRLLATESPDLVILDLMMPGVDGFQVLEQLRGKDKTQLIPVIVLTGKMLSYEDVKRLDSPKVFLQTKGVLSNLETSDEIGRILTAPSALPQPTSLLVKQALACIQQNYTRALSLTELAWTVGVSKSYLSRIFKLETGISLWDYLNRFRVLKAKELLLQTDDSITDIAADVGYDDAGYFGRIFREIVDCSPRTYRQKARASIVGAFPERPPL